VAGNHETGLDLNYNNKRKNVSQEEGKELRELLRSCCTYLEHEMVEVEGIKIFGSPYTPNFHDWAFMYDEKDAKSIWAIEGPVDILVTHGPPFGILDKVSRVCVGCPELQSLVFQLKPKYHLFGHIHPGYGHQVLDNIEFYNCSLVDDRYKVVNKPHVINYLRNTHINK
jgi:Icc-related predicted phosphoesterase